MSRAVPSPHPFPAVIPRIIHQIFFGGQEAAPPDYRRYAATWRANHAGWDYQFWDAKRCRALLAADYAWFLPVYDGYRHRIQRVDAIRCFILHRFGGVYADMDIESRRPIDELIDGRELLFGSLGPGFTNAVMGSAAAHPLWPHAFDKLKERSRRFARNAPLWSKATMPMHVGYSTGPIMLTDCLRETGYAAGGDPAVNVCPTWMFEPLAPHSGAATAADGTVDVSRSYAVHHMSMHWVPRRHKAMGALLGLVAKVFVRSHKRTQPAADDRPPTT